MAFVAAAQRAALAGISWPTHGFDPQGRAQLAGIVTPEAAVADLTGIELRAALAGIAYPGNFNTAFGRGVAAGFIGADETAPDTHIETFTTEWNLIPTWTLAETANDGFLGIAAGEFTIHFTASSFSEGTLEELKRNHSATSVRFNDFAGSAVNIENVIARRVNT